MSALYPYGNINTAGVYAPNSYASYIPSQTQTFPQNYQTQQQPVQNNNSGNLFTVAVSSEEEVNNYPVAAGTTVLLISFNLNKFWLKKTGTNGVPEPLRVFPFKEEMQVVEQNNTAVTREEFNSLVKNVEKLIHDLGGVTDG